MTVKELLESLSICESICLRSAWDDKVLFRSWVNKKEKMGKYEGLRVVSIRSRMRNSGVESVMDLIYSYIEVYVSDYDMRHKKEE